MKKQWTLRVALTLSFAVIPGIASALEYKHFDQTAVGGKLQTLDKFGYSLAVGDLDGNGANDLAIGTPGDTSEIDWDPRSWFDFNIALLPISFSPELHPRHGTVSIRYGHPISGVEEHETCHQDSCASYFQGTGPAAQ